ncbi:MAG: N-acetyltransferase family protein [Candidatus Ranarchaeia archaeon]
MRRKIKESEYSFVSKKGREIKVRLMEPNDVNVLWNIFNEVVEERRYLPTLTPVFSQREKRQWYLDLQEKIAIVLVATFGDSPIGYCSVEQKEEEASAHVALVGLLISKAFRSEGVGKELMKKSIEFSRDIGFEKLCLSTFECNNKAIHLYESLGFRKVGLRKNQFKLNVTYHNELMMDLTLEVKKR